MPGGCVGLPGGCGRSVWVASTAIVPADERAIHTGIEEAEEALILYFPQQLNNQVPHLFTFTHTATPFLLISSVFVNLGQNDLDFVKDIGQNLPFGRGAGSVVKKLFSLL